VGIWCNCVMLYVCLPVCVCACVCAFYSREFVFCVKFSLFYVLTNDAKCLMFDFCVVFV